MKNFEYDDSQLRRLFAELDEKQRVKALRGAFRSQARIFRKAAIATLRSKQNKSGTTFHSSEALEKGVRQIVYKKTLGFRVTVGTQVRIKKTSQGKKRTYIGFHSTSRGKDLPILIWAEEGTEERRWKNRKAVTETDTRDKRGRRHIAKRYGRLDKSHGRMKRFGYMDDTRKKMAGGITESLHQAIATYVIKTAKRNGCTI